MATERGLVELANRPLSIDLLQKGLVGRVIRIDEKDEQLRNTIDLFATTAISRIESERRLSTPEGLASVVSEEIYQFVGDEERLACRYALDAITPHRLVSRFVGSGQEKCACIDYALMNYLVLEKLGVSGSRVVMVQNNGPGLPDFHLVLGNKILDFETGKWVKKDVFARKRRMDGYTKTILTPFYP